MSHLDNKTYLTAKTRLLPSVPARFLMRGKYSKKMVGKILDYGCGKGKDAEVFGWDKWDPFYAPELIIKENSYDVIVCTYVLNVLTKRECENAIERIQYALKESGTAYITVRRDLPVDGYTTSQGVQQKYIHLKLPILVTNSLHCIYILKKDSKGVGPF